MCYQVDYECYPIVLEAACLLIQIVLTIFNLHRCLSFELNSSHLT